MAVRTWDSNKACLGVMRVQTQGALMTTPDSEPQTTAVSLTKKVEKRELIIGGTGKVDLQITLDYSDSFYRAETSLKAASGSGGDVEPGYDSEEAAALAEAQHSLVPASVDFSKKESTTYLFTNVPAGRYELKLRQRFKEKGCASSVTVVIKSAKASIGSISLDNAGFRG